jgi:hypothetical protein
LEEEGRRRDQVIKRLFDQTISLHDNQSAFNAYHLRFSFVRFNGHYVLISQRRKQETVAAQEEQKSLNI